MVVRFILKNISIQQTNTMAFKFVVLATLLAVANAGYLGAPAAVGYAAPAYGYAAPAAYAAPSVAAIGQNTYRNFGNTQQVSTYSKALDTPFSSVRKTDVRVTNDGLAYGAAPAYASYAAPSYAHTYAAPAAYAQTYAAPAAYATPYAAHGYAAPAYAHGYAAPIAKVAAPAALGVAYSAAPVVAHMTFSGLGVNYAY